MRLTAAKRAGRMVGLWPFAITRVDSERPLRRTIAPISRAERLRLEDLDVGAPAQDPGPDLQRAGHPGAPGQGAVGVPRDRLGRVPGRLGHARRDRAVEAQDDLHHGWSATIPQARSRVASISPSGGGSNSTGVRREAADPLELEGAEPALRLVEADQVERVRVGRRLDEVGPDAGRARLAGGVVGAGVIGQLHDPALRPRLGEQAEVSAPDRIERPGRHHVERSPDVAGQDRRQGLAELLEGCRQVGVVRIGVAGHEARREEDRHRLRPRKPERGEERPARRCPTGRARPRAGRPAHPAAPAGPGRHCAATSRRMPRSGRASRPPGWDSR